MSGIDFDALETRVRHCIRGVTIGIDDTLALIALARRTEEAERECAAEREAALHAERERDEATARAESAEAAYARMCLDADEEAKGRESAESRLATLSTAFDNLRARVVAVADKACGPHPVQTADEALEAIERSAVVVVAERDEARAALAEACSIARWWYTGDLNDPNYPASNICKTHADRIAELRKVVEGSPDACTVSDAVRADVQGGGLPAPSAGPLDPAHVEVLRGMLDEERFAWKHVDKDEDVAHHAARIAALEAVLGEEAKP